MKLLIDVWVFQVVNGGKLIGIWVDLNRLNGETRVECLFLLLSSAKIILFDIYLDRWEV